MMKVAILLALVAVACATPVSYYYAPAAYAPSYTAYTYPEKSSVAVSNANGNYAYSIQDQKAHTVYAANPAVSYVQPPVAYYHTPYIYG